MSAEDLRSLVERWYEVLNREDWEDNIDQFDPGQDWWEEWKADHREFRRAFPDYHFTSRSQLMIDYGTFLKELNAMVDVFCKVPQIE